MTDQQEEETPFRVTAQEFNEACPLDDLREHPANPNFGDVGAISESLDAHGFYGAVIVQKSTGYIVAGNHRFRTAQMKGATTLPAFLLDIDDDEAARILAVDNRTTHLATFDTEKLIALLAPLHLSSPRGLRGTGYDGDALDDLVQMLKPPKLEDLAGGGDDPKPDDLWPVLRFKVPPEARDAFYEVTDAAEEKDDTGRFIWLVKQQAGEP